MSEAINPNTLYSHDDLERMVGAYTVRVWREHGLPYLPGFYGILGINLIEFLQSNHEAKKRRTLTTQGQPGERAEASIGLRQDAGGSNGSEGAATVAIPGGTDPFISRKSA